MSTLPKCVKAIPIRCAVIIVSFLVLALLGCHLSPLRTTRSGHNIVSLVQLLATPEKFDRMLVHVEGYYHKAFEVSGLFLTKDDAKYSSQNAIWIGTWAEGADTNVIERVNDVFVTVEGTFNYTPKGGGHLGAWPSELNCVTLLVRASDGVRKE